jgi:V/A-type H+/Na+-transporting ATPase subunit A
MVGLMVKFYREAQKALKAGIPLADIRAMPIIPALLKSKFEIPEDQLNKFDELDKQINEQFHKAAAVAGGGGGESVPASTTEKKEAEVVA